MRTLPASLDFQMLFLGGDARHFLGGLFFMFFFVFRKNAHTPAIYHHFVAFGAIVVVFVHFALLIFRRPRHFAWTLLTQFGAFFLRLGAQGHNVMKPVSQGTLNVRFARIQASPSGPFWMHFCCFFRFCDFAETGLPCRRQYIFASLGGARPSLFTHGPPLKKQLCEKGP